MTGDPALLAALPSIKKGRVEALRPLLQHPDAETRYFYTRELGNILAREVWKSNHQLFYDHYPAHVNYLECILEKWGGSHAEAREFCRVFGANGPAGSDLAVLMVVALIEKWLYYAAFERDLDKAQEFLENPNVSQTTADAYRQSFGSPRETPQPFPWCYLEAGGFQRARKAAGLA